MFSLSFLLLSLIGLSVNRDNAPETDGHILDLDASQDNRCPRNEVFSYPVDDCNTCIPAPCRVRDEYGCNCRSGYARETLTGLCIPRVLCPLVPPTTSTTTTTKPTSTTMQPTTTTTAPTSTRKGQLPLQLGQLPQQQEPTSEGNKCILYVEGNGSVNCTGNDRRTVCDIECAGKNEGTFVCTPEEGWNSTLPNCAKEVKNGYSSSCSENEIESDCVSPCNTCEQRGMCDPPPTCQQGCDCRPGFFRDENGYCVPEQQCAGRADKPRCPKNAMYVPCCPLVIPSCENPDPEPDSDDKCVPGCVCRPGFLKYSDDQCVPADQCYQKEDRGKETPGMCREDESYYECTPSCKNTCENIHNPRVKCQCGPPGCFCREGLVKAPDGKCVHPTHCPRLPSTNDPGSKCPKNAIFIKCGSPCPPTCDDLEPQPCEEKCVTACYCKPGYLKRKDGVCVRPIDCHPRKKQEKPEPKCPENAIFIECGSACPPTCQNRLPDPCEENCTRACYCKPGYLLKIPEGKCVKPHHCNTSRIPDPASCPVNEELSDCVVPCNDCKIKGNCQFFACNKGCDCKKGYFRDQNGTCILASECTQKMDPQTKCATDEQFYDCTPSCKNTCENIYNPAAKCQCAPPGCFCKEGLVKRDDGKCVPPEQCEMTPAMECNADEQFYECTPSCRNTCENFRNRGAKCYCGPPSCFCKKGLVKRSDGKCVPPSQCQVPPQHQCGADQKFYNCTPSCKNTCKNFFNPAIRCGCGPPGCFCKDGLVKRADGKCIPPEQCHERKPATCTENAEFSSCGPACRPTCSDPYPAPCAGACVKGCFCKPGFVQHTDGRCVRLENCNTTCSSPGEEFQGCGSTCPDTCENRGRHPPASCPYRCIRGCFCRKGLYRTKRGHCVPLQECDKESYFTTTAKPTMTREYTDLLPVDCHGCPNRAECEAYCRTLGDFIGLCIGAGRLHCRCV